MGIKSLVSRWMALLVMAIEWIAPFHTKPEEDDSEPNRLIPPPVTEDPFGISLLALYDNRLDLIWQWDACEADDS